MNFIASLLAIFILASPTQFKSTFIDRIERSIVPVTHIVPATDDHPPIPSLCTGFVIDTTRGWVMTARHCVDDNSDMYVDGKLSKIVKENDWLAILTIEPLSHPVLDFASGKPEVTQPTISFGYGYGYMKVMQRYVAGYEDEGIILDGPLAHGMSGGPTVDSDGRVIGLSQATTEAAALLTSSEDMKKFIKGK